MTTKDPMRRSIPSPGTSRGRRFAGVHLSGSNANKTALVVLEGEPFDQPLRVVKVYEKIGSFGTLFSDERLADILVHAGPFEAVFVDCPLTVPPCVACQRPTCPGAVKCDDLAVAYMLSISSKVRRRGARKARPVNPQSQRLWDVMRLASAQKNVKGESLVPPEGRAEPSYSANLAPLVARARTLQRRLNALTPRIALFETQVPGALDVWRDLLDLPDDAKVSYRSFEDGLALRQSIAEAMADEGWVSDEAAEDSAFDALSRTVEGFHAFISAMVGAFYFAGQTDVAPKDFVPSEGWVHLPVEDDEDLSAAHEPPPKRYFE